jgi:hypothetical protein
MKLVKSIHTLLENYEIYELSLYNLDNFQYLTVSRSSSVGTTMGYGPDSPDSIHDRDNFFSLFQNVQTSSVAHSDSY